MEAKVAKSVPAALKSLRESGILCVKPEYIAEFLAQEPPPAVADYVVPL